MKLALVTFLAVLGCATALLAPSRPLACDDETLDVEARWCNFIPAGCKHAVCGQDTISGSQRWFKSTCDMSYHNLICRTHIQRALESACAAIPRPEQKAGPCPVPWRV